MSLHAEIARLTAALAATKKQLETERDERKRGAAHIRKLEKDMADIVDFSVSSVEKVDQAKEEVQVLELMLKREKDRANFLRKENTRMKWEMEKEKETTTTDSEAVTNPKMMMPACDICSDEYSEHPDKTPRILACGHTLCEECAGTLAEKTSLMCPFDRKDTKLREAGVIALPRNYTILQMIGRR